MSETNLQVILSESGLEQPRVQELLSSFKTYFDESKAIAASAKSIVVTDASQVDDMTAARTARLQLKNIRVEVENTRKQLKEQSLREGKAIDGIANVLKALIIPAEEHLELQENFVKLQEERRLADRLIDRQAKLGQYVEDTSLYNLDTMDDAAFEKLLTFSKTAYDNHQAEVERIEKERVAAAEKEKAEQERIRLENEQLRKDNEAKELELKKEREEKYKLEEEARLKKEAEDKAKAEEEARIAKEKAEAVEKEKAALLAPDKTKLMNLAVSIRETELPTVQSKEAQALLAEISGYLSKTATLLEQKARNL